LGKTKKEYKKLDGFGSKIISDIGNPAHLKFAENELKFCETNHIKINLRHLHDLPKLLNECDDAPVILYQKGIMMILNKNKYGRNKKYDFLRKAVY
jgi:DNA processing protein